MANFDFTPTNGKNLRPSAARIVKAWKDAGRPKDFTVEYGETFARFERISPGVWDDSGNGCRGVDRNAVVAALKADAAKRAARFSDLYR